MAGFVVVEAGEDVPGAIPVNAEILRFWSWNTGYWTFAFHFVTDVSIQAGVPSFEKARTVSGSMLLRSAVMAGEHSFINTTTKGLDNFVMNLQMDLEADGANAVPRLPAPESSH